MVIKFKNCIYTIYLYIILHSSGNDLEYISDGFQDNRYHSRVIGFEHIAKWLQRSNLDQVGDLVKSKGNAC